MYLKRASKSFEDWILLTERLKFNYQPNDYKIYLVMENGHPINSHTDWLILDNAELQWYLDNKMFEYLEPGTESI